MSLLSSRNTLLFAFIIFSYEKVFSVPPGYVSAIKSFVCDFTHDTVRSVRATEGNQRLLAGVVGGVLMVKYGPGLIQAPLEQDSVGARLAFFATGFALGHGAVYVAHAIRRGRE